MWSAPVGTTPADRATAPARSATPRPHDYATKPFKTRDLLDRIRVWIRANQHLTAAYTRVWRQDNLARELVQDLDAIVWEADLRSHQATFVSHRAEELLGYPVGQWLEDPEFWSRIIHPDDRAVLAGIFRPHQGPARRESEFRIVAADGHVVWLHNRVRLARDDGGRHHHLRGVSIEVTEHRQAEEQVRQLQKLEAVGNLAGGMAHDFNNLLTVINGCSELLRSQLEPADSRHRLATEIAKAGERAAVLTQQLLAFSRRQALTPEVLDLNAVVAGVDQMLERLIGAHNRLTTTLDPALTSIQADRGSLEQVLVNLVVNARDAMPQGGKISTETANVELDQAHARQRPPSQPGRYVLLSVSDTGSGMDAATQARVFEPFFTTKELGTGTGLGLSMVYGIVKRSGGYIWVDSRLGRGTTFQIYLPPTEATAAPAAPRLARPEVSRGTETILVVEDQEQVLALAGNALTACGYTVLAARQGEEALRLSANYPEPIHLLVTDVVLSGMNGRELAQQLQTLRPGIAVPCVSGYTHQGLGLQPGFEAGTAFLQKPFIPSTLAAKVREVLAARRA